MSEKRERTYYRVYEVDERQAEEHYYAEAEGPNALAEAKKYAFEIDVDQSQYAGHFTSAIYKVTEIEEKI